MVISFLESIRHTGYYLPLAFLRVYLGYTFLDMGIEKFNGDYLLQPQLAAVLNESLRIQIMPEWYSNLIESVVVPNWKIFAFWITYCEVLVGISLILGFLVRPVMIIASFMALNFVLSHTGHMAQLYQVYLALFVVMWWMGAGRCIGLDYYFYKRQRGLWW